MSQKTTPIQIKIFIIIFVISLLSLIPVFAFYYFQDEEENLQEQEVKESSQIFTSPQGADLEITNPNLSKQVNCPLEIEGKIPGIWFFEADFAIEISQNEEILETVIATAQEDWMTEEAVEFFASYDCNNCQDGSLDLLFIRDNPSDLLENNDTISVNIPDFNCNQNNITDETNAESQEDQDIVSNQSKMIISLFFVEDGVSENTCQEVFEVNREVPFSEAIATKSIEELLKGTNHTESDQGFFSEIPEGVRLNSIQIENQQATVDFSQELNQAAGSCRVSLIQAQITETLKHFESVDTVVITAEGQEALQP